MLLSLKLPRLRLARPHRVDPLRFLRLALQRWEEMRVAITSRRALARMDARMLADIGISPGEAQEEISRRPWDTVTRPR